MPPFITTFHARFIPYLIYLVCCRFWGGRSSGVISYRFIARFIPLSSAAVSLAFDRPFHSYWSGVREINTLPYIHIYIYIYIFIHICMCLFYYLVTQERYTTTRSIPFVHLIATQRISLCTFLTQLLKRNLFDDFAASGYLQAMEEMCKEMQLQ